MQIYVVNYVYDYIYLIAARKLPRIQKTGKDPGTCLISGREVIIMGDRFVLLLVPTCFACRGSRELKTMKTWLYL